MQCMQCRKEKPVYEFVTEEPEMMGDSAVCSDCVWAISLGHKVERAPAVMPTSTNPQRKGAAANVPGRSTSPVEPSLQGFWTRLRRLLRL